MHQWKDKVVVITGGSSGLGSALAQQFATAGARVVCLARGQEQLQATVEELTAARDLDVQSVVADVTDDQSVSSAVASVLASHGQIDVWINNVGKSLRIALADATVANFEDLMQINFYSAVRCTRAVIDELERSGGSLINIGSLASKTGWPFVSPYSASKHALAAYHHQLRLEGPAAVHYLLVCPGPIRRSDSQTRYADQAVDLPDGVAKPGAGAKVKGIAPDDLAQRIRLACEKRQLELVMPWKARIAFALSQLSPWLGDKLLRRFN